MKELWDKHKANIGLLVLVIYTLSLGVATADEVFHLGLFPTKLDKMIAESINKLESDDEQVWRQGYQDIVEYGDFAVPQLIKALDKEQGETKTRVLQALEEIQGEKKASEQEWKDWYQQNKDRF